MTDMLINFEAGTLVHVDPGTLLLERNIREATPSKDLVKSIKALGLLEPISAVVNADGQLLVRYGHRRTLGAIEAELPTVPVYVIGTDADDALAEIDRIISQRDENTHRSGLTTSDEIGVVAQLAAFGLTAAQITKQGRIGRETVDAAILVNGSELASKAAEKYAGLTLDQAVAVAEFEDDAEVAKELIVMALKEPERFNHRAQRLRDDRKTVAAIADLHRQLEEAGIRAIPRPTWEDKPKSLSNLLAGDDSMLDAENHAECPGHVAWHTTGWAYVNDAGDLLDEDAAERALEAQFADVDQEVEDFDEDAHEAAYEEARAQLWDGYTNRQILEPLFGCEDPKAHGHKDRYNQSSGASTGSGGELSEKEKAAAKKNRTTVIENNKAWTSAEAVRREWLATFAKRKTAPKGTAGFIAQSIALDAVTMSNGKSGEVLGSEWLGLKQAGGYGKSAVADHAVADEVSEPRALQVALVLVLAGHEDYLAAGAWRHDGTNNQAGRYLRFLQAAGYGLSDVEEYAISKKTV